MISVGGRAETHAGRAVLDVYQHSWPAEKKIVSLADNLTFPSGIALSPDEKTLYINDFDNQRVPAVPIVAAGELNGGFAHVFGGTLAGGWGWDGDAMDNKGNLYVVHYGAGEVVVIDPNGFIVGTTPLPSGARTPSRFTAAISTSRMDGEERGMAGQG